LFKKAEDKSVESCSFDWDRRKIFTQNLTIRYSGTRDIASESKTKITNEIDMRTISLEYTVYNRK